MNKKKFSRQYRKLEQALDLLRKEEKGPESVMLLFCGTFSEAWNNLKTHLLIVREYSLASVWMCLTLCLSASMTGRAAYSPFIIVACVPLWIVGMRSHMTYRALIHDEAEMKKSGVDMSPLGIDRPIGRFSVPSFRILGIVIFALELYSILIIGDTEAAFRGVRGGLLVTMATVIIGRCLSIRQTGIVQDLQDFSHRLWWHIWMIS